MNLSGLRIRRRFMVVIRTLEATVGDIEAWDGRCHVEIDGDDPNAEAVGRRHWFSPILRKWRWKVLEFGGVFRRTYLAQRRRRLPDPFYF